MAEEIIDGTGKGYTAKVDSENRLRTSSVTESQDYHINSEGKVWSLDVSVTPTGANDYFFYFKNTGTEDVHISAFRVSSTVATEIAVDVVTGTAVGGTTNVPIARNLGSSKAPTAIIETGVDITGLTKTGRVLFLECAVADTAYTEEIISNLILPQGTAVALKRVAATGLVNATVSLLGAS